MRKIVISIWLTAFYAVFGQIDQSYEIYTWTTMKHELFDGEEITVYTFQPEKLMLWGIPGYTMENIEGDSVSILFHNMSQGAPHTIHLHGLDVDQANDGVPMTSHALEHHEEFVYKYKAPHPGTYLYHCHVHSTLHVQMGMYGMIVVHPSNGKKESWNDGYSFEKDVRWLFSEVDKSWHDTIPRPDTNDVLYLPKYTPDYFLINGLSQSQLRDSVDLNIEKDQKIIWRLANIGFLKNRVIIPSELNALLISSDGRPLPKSIEIDTLTLFPGERYQLILEPKSFFSDSIKVEYINMNTQQVEGIEKVEVVVDRFYGIEERSDQIRFYPNPTKRYVTLDAIQNVDFYSVYDASGRVVLNEKLSNSPNERIDLNAVSKGTYYIEVFGNGKTALIKVVKE